VHGDDKGAVIPPRVAEIQAMLIAVGITAKTSDEDRAGHYERIKVMTETLRSAGIRADSDVRDHYNAGWKMSEYELRGVPLRIEFGPRDATSGVVTTVRRDNSSKETVDIKTLAEGVQKILDTMQKAMFDKANAEFAENRKVVTDWTDIVPILNKKQVVLIPSCLDGPCVEAVKSETAALAKAKTDQAPEDKRAPSMGAKSLCIPFEQPTEELPAQCLRPSCGKPASKWVLFGRSY